MHRYLICDFLNYFLFFGTKEGQSSSLTTLLEKDGKV